MANRWLAHVKSTMKRMKSSGTYKKGDGLKKVIMAAKKTYSKGKRGGAEEGEEAEAPEMAEEGGRRKSSRRTRRKSRR